MDIIKQNPYRVLGLLGNSSERELQKQVGAIKRFAEVGKVKEFDLDLGFLGDVPRAVEDIQSASSKLEQPYNKLHYSLFWFVKYNSLDEIALSNLKDENFQKAFDIWKKTLKGDVTDKNFSSYHNFSTLCLLLSVSNQKIDLTYLNQCVYIKQRLIESSAMGRFVELVADDRLVINAVDIGKSFADEIIKIVAPYISNGAGVTTKDVMGLFDNYPRDVQKHVSNKFTAEPISKIEKSITDTAENRKADPSRAAKYGEKLYNDTKRTCSQLEVMLGRGDPQLQSVVNKLTEEIMQCSIDFFNEFIDEQETFDPIDAALHVARYASKLGATGSVKMRAQENTEIIEGWSNSRSRDLAIKEISSFITDKISNLEKNSSEIDVVERFVKACQYSLKEAKAKLGANDAYYISLCDAVVNNALSVIIDVLNKGQDDLDHSTVSEFKESAEYALCIIDTLSAHDISEALSDRVATNRRAIIEVKDQLANMTFHKPSDKALREALSRAENSSKGACYIATMAYGDYDHPKVMMLRKYRDETLVNTILGRCFIKIYYATSPYMVVLLKDQKQMNNLIRHGLDKLIGCLK